MAANNLGTAYIKIAPQMQGIQKSISDGLAGIKSSSIPGAAAVGTIVAKGVSAAMNLVTSSVDGAIRRTDILNNFPKVMANLGISAKDAQKAIDKLNKGLDGLPTTLQDGASAVQRFTSKNNDVKKSTDIFLALNNAILAGGAPTEQQATALEQLSQAYAKGKPDMVEWRSAYSAMPAQLNQVAEAMGLGKNAADKLGEQLRSGKISMDDFMNAIVRLNSKGVGNFASFEKQARDASGGIGTAMTNLSSRAQKAVGTIIQAFGSKNLSDTINKFSSSFSGIADWIAKNIVPVIKNTVIPALKNVIGVLKNIVEFIAQNKWVQNFLTGLLGTLLAFKAVSTVKAAIVGLITPIVTLATSLGTATTAFKAAQAAGLTFSTSMGAASASTTGFVSGLTGLVAKITAVGAALGAIGSLGALAAVGGVIGIIYGETIKAQTAEIKATTAAREYARAHYDLDQAAKSAAKAQKILKEETDNLRNAQLAANDAELAAIRARKDQITYQTEMNRLKKEGKQNTDEFREAELSYKIALLEEEDANKKLAESQKKVKKAKESIDDLNTSEMYKANIVLGNIYKQHHEYGNLALQLDNLKNKTITYQDANGKMVEVSKEKAAEMVNGLAQQLAYGDNFWSQIVDIANQKGISFSEACAKYGAQGGKEMMQYFKSNADFNLPRISQAGEGALKVAKQEISKLSNEGKIGGGQFITSTADGIRSKYVDLLTAAQRAVAKARIKANEEATKAYDVGKNLTEGAAKGTKDSGALSRLFANARSVMAQALAAMKKQAQEHSPSKATQEMGKFLTMGLAIGIEDYADEAVNAAKNVTAKTLDAMNQKPDFSLDGSMNRLQPQTALTGAQNGSGGQVIQYNDFTVDSELDVKEISKRLGWQVATAL